MTDRDPALQTPLTSVRDALAARHLALDETATIDRVQEALSTVGDQGTRPGRRLLVCGFLPEAFANARRHSPTIARIIDAFEVIEPGLYWAPRSAGGPHANAMIAGPGRLESRSDVQIGVSLLAPHVCYPDRSHAPEEVYLVLSPR
jgi:hypothetical protein